MYTCVICKHEFQRGSVAKYKGQFYCFQDLEEQLKQDLVMRGAQSDRMSHVP